GGPSSSHSSWCSRARRWSTQLSDSTFRPSIRCGCSFLEALKFLERGELLDRIILAGGDARGFKRHIHHHHGRGDVDARLLAGFAVELAKLGDSADFPREFLGEVHDITAALGARSLG